MVVMPDVEVVYVRDVSSGTVHRWAQIVGNPELLTYESDNKDQMGELERVGEAILTDGAIRLCGRCFPESREG